jgi:SAM-dependent methyltransferase
VLRAAVATAAGENYTGTVPCPADPAHATVQLGPSEGPSVSESSWSEQQIRDLLAAEDFAYQNVELPHGLATGGVDRSRTARAILPDDLEGKTVLDVGSKFGYFCFEAVKRGAKRVVGIDVDPDSVRKARLLADCTGHDAHFECLDAEVDVPRESFDYVLCLNLLHHLRDPLALIERLTAITRERLVLETAALGGHDRRKLGVSRVAAAFLARAPILFVSRNGTSGKRSVQKFFITAPALENLLLHHRHAFARVDFRSSDHKDRFCAIAHRRRIDHLIVVAGPTSSGKSTLIEELRGDAQPEIAAHAGIDSGAQWPCAGSKQLSTFSEPQLPRLLFHYDFLRPYLRSAKVHARDEGLDVLESAKRVTTLTLWCSPAQLREQLRRGEIAPKTLLGRYFGLRRHRLLEEEYADPERLREHYRRWFAHLRTRPGEHWVVALEGGVRILPIDAWESLPGGDVGPVQEAPR